LKCLRIFRIAKAPANIMTALVIATAAALALNAPSSVPFVHIVELWSKALQGHH
jgi:hypothetical protein